MKNEKMYVWRLGFDESNRPYTVASVEMEADDLELVPETDPNQVDHDLMNHLVHKFGQYLNKKYLTEHKGNITFSKFPSYELCMAEMKKKANDIRFDVHPTPTEH